MQSEEVLRNELKRLPRILKHNVRDGDFETALETYYIIQTLEWVLSDD